MEKLKILIQYVQKKFGRQNKDTESEEEIGSYSMNEGKADKVFGFRREIIKGVGIFFGTVFVLALIFASGDEETYNKDIEELPKVTASEIAEVKKPKNSLPNDYETLIAMNKAKEEELRRQAEEEAKKLQEKQTPEPINVVEVPIEPPAQLLPTVPPVHYEEIPAVIPIQTIPEEMPEKVVEKIEKKPPSDEGKYKSTISFGISEKQNAVSKDSSETDSKIKNVAQVKAEYYEPNDSTLEAGTVIPVRLLTGVNTDLEGQVMAEILTDVYDTATGTNLLIPQGSKLIGSYEKKSVTNGRVGVSFKQLNLPDGGSWTISENIVAVDGAGYTGIAGKVNHHTGRKLSAGAVSSSIAALGSLAAGNVSANNETYTAGQIAMQGATANLINITSSLLRESADVKNTVTIEPGYEFNVYVTNNITF